MERLTHRIGSGEANLIGIYEAKGPVEKAILRQSGWNRLADHEDFFDKFGTPDEITAALAELKAYKDAEDKLALDNQKRFMEGINSILNHEHAAKMLTRSDADDAIRGKS